MIVNIGLWQRPDLFGDFGDDLRGYTNPFINTFLKPFGQKLDGLPAWPVFETLVGVILITAALYYAVAVRGRAPDVEADRATGEALIG